MLNIKEVLNLFSCLKYLLIAEKFFYYNIILSLHKKRRIYFCVIVSKNGEKIEFSLRIRGQRWFLKISLRNQKRGKTKKDTKDEKGNKNKKIKIKEQAH